MKIHEIDLTVGKKYKCSDGSVYKVNKYGIGFDFCLGDKDRTLVTDRYYLSELLSLEFEEFVDWSKVEVDDEIEVWNEFRRKWVKRYFARYDKETNKIYCWLYGATSWSAESDRSCEKVRLYKEVK